MTEPDNTVNTGDYFVMAEDPVGRPTYRRHVPSANVADFVASYLGAIGTGAVQAAIDAHIADTSAAHAATAVSYAGAAGLSSTTVEAALDELDAEKAALSHTHAASAITSGTIDAARIGASGTRDTTTFLRGDNVWAAPDGTVPYVPPPASGTALTDETFDGGGTSGDAPSTLNTSVAVITGSGTLYITDAFAMPNSGGLGLAVDGTAQHILTFGNDYATHNSHFASVYYRHDRTPSDVAWLIAVRNGNDSATTCQIGINATGYLVIRDGDTGAIDDTAATPFAVGGVYRWDFTLAGGTLTVRFYTGTTLNSTATVDAVDTVICSVSLTSYSNDMLGLLVALSSTGAATGNLKNETFELGTNGAAPTTGTTTASFWGGTSGACTFSNAHAQVGSLSLHVTGTAPTYNSGRYDNVSHSDHFVSFYLYYIASGTGNTYLYELRDGGTTIVAAQIGINSTGHLFIRDYNPATGLYTTVDTATAALTTNTMYRVDYSGAGAGGQILDYYTGANLTSTNTANSTEQLTGALTATNFSNELIGLIATAAGTPNFHIDAFRSDSAALPVGTVAVGIGGVFDRYLSDTAALPTPLNATTPPVIEGNLIPATGAYCGATTGTVGTQGSSSTSGMSTYMGITNNIRPHLVHVYKTGPSWDGRPTPTEYTMFRPSSGMPAIPFWTWKPNTAMTFAQIAAGGADTAIVNVANGLKAYGHPQMFGIQHEPDNDALTGGNSMANYVLMFRHVVTLMKAQGVTANHAVFVMNYVGYSSLAGSNAANFAALYPGDDVVDWIAYDPYYQTGRDGLETPDGLFNEDLSGVTGYTGFYDWATTARSGFVGTKPLMCAEWGTDFRSFIDSQAAAKINQVTAGIANYPQIKAMVWWNSTTPSGIDSQLSGHALSIAAYRAFAQLAYMTQTIT